MCTAWQDAIVVEIWSALEVDRVIDVYFSMLEKELGGEEYNKSAFRARLRSEIDRSNGSVEYKFQNVSAVLAEIGAVFIDGYKPARNVQQLLRQRVVERFQQADGLRQQMLQAVEAPPSRPRLELSDPSPVPMVPIRTDHSPRGRRIARRDDYQKIEAENRALGLAGERAVVRRERRRLADAGRLSLAERVRHVSVLDGDGLGFDVLSFESDGAERYLEVKTTRYSPQQPFFVSHNELELSGEEPDRFTLVRVFRFETPRAGFYELPGSLRLSADLQPATFVARPRRTSV